MFSSWLLWKSAAWRLSASCQMSSRTQGQNLPVVLCLAIRAHLFERLLFLEILVYALMVDPVIEFPYSSSELVLR